jgi:hypothetical protein
LRRLAHHVSGSVTNQWAKAAHASVRQQQGAHGNRRREDERQAADCPVEAKSLPADQPRSRPAENARVLALVFRCVGESSRILIALERGRRRNLRTILRRRCARCGEEPYAECDRMACHPKLAEGERRMVSQNFASWNQLDRWLRQVEGLRRLA